MMQLYIANKNYSSWSMRPWLVLKAFDLAFEEIQLNFPCERGEGVSQSRPFSLGTAGRVGEDLFTTSRRQGVTLQIKVLVVGRYPRISDFHCVVRQVVRAPIL